MKSPWLLIPILIATQAVEARPKQRVPSLQSKGISARPPMSVDGLPIGGLPAQDLPPGKCAAFLWTTTANQTLIAMISTDPALIRYAPGGVVGDLARTSAMGTSKFGVATQSSFASGTARIVAELTIVERADITNGASIPSGILTITGNGTDSIIVPVIGLIGCG